jgi:aspartate kinase
LRVITKKTPLKEGFFNGNMRSIEQRPIVVKFGGSSLANAERIKIAKEAVQGNSDRRFVVVSAPGKGDSNNPIEDKKVTDLLIAKDFGSVRQRFMSIGEGLKLGIVNDLVEEVESGMDNHGDDWIKSRGEWLMGKVFSEFLDGRFVDPSKLIKLRKYGGIDPITYELIHEQLSDDNTVYVVPGFYGANIRTGAVQCFARGGSDITGAVIARGVGASIYENWTDVDGIRATDPKIVPHARSIREITYKEFRELGNGGAEVLHPASILPVAEEGIPINLRNTNNPTNPGTIILNRRDSKPHENVVAIAGRKGFVSVQIEKYGMNEEEGIGEQVLLALHRLGIPFDHIPTGQDSISILIHEDYLIAGKEEKLKKDIVQSIQPDDISSVYNIGLVSLIGQGIRDHHTHINRIAFDALDDAGIDTTAQVSRTRGNSIVLAVDDEKVTSVIRTLYEALII